MPPTPIGGRNPGGAGEITDSPSRTLLFLQHVQGLLHQPPPELALLIRVKGGSPNTCGIARPDRIRLAPVFADTETRLVTCTVGMPPLSSSFAIAAPQRVQVPQAEVRMTPSTPSSSSDAAMSRAILAAVSMGVPLPVVE